MGKKLALLLSVILVAVSLSACSGSKGKNTETDGESNISEDEKIFNELFNLENKVTVRIDISDKELEKIQKDFDKYDSMGNKSPIYRIADKVTITIGDESYEIEEVGIRIKGNTTRESVWDRRSGNLNLTHSVLMRLLMMKPIMVRKQKYGPVRKNVRQERTDGLLH